MSRYFFEVLFMRFLPTVGMTFDEAYVEKERRQEVLTEPLVVAPPLYIILLLLLSNFQLFAQKTPNEFQIFAGSGVNFMLFQPAVKERSSFGFNGDVGLGFTGFFNPNWGIHIGAGFGLYNIQNKVKKIETLTPNLIDLNAYPYELHSTLNEYQERQRAMFLSLPVMLQFQTKMNQGWNWKKGQRKGFYAMTGIKLLLLVKNDYEAKVASLYNAAWYPDFENWAFTQTFAGYGFFNGNDNASGKFGMGFMAMFALEAGMKWQIAENLFLYTGVYIDYGLNDPTKNKRVSPAEYIDPEKLPDLKLLAFADRMNMMLVGIKLRLAFFKKQNRYACPY